MIEDKIDYLARKMHAPFVSDPKNALAEKRETVDVFYESEGKENLLKVFSYWQYSEEFVDSAFKTFYTNAVNGIKSHSYALSSRTALKHARDIDLEFLTILSGEIEKGGENVLENVLSHGYDYSFASTTKKFVSEHRREEENKRRR